MYNNPFDKLTKKVSEKLARVIPQGIGRIAVNHFKDSFNMQRFNDAGSPAWKQVKRREPDSEWYGFKLGNKARRPGRKARKPDGKGNFSKAATTQDILQPTGKMRDSTFVKSASFREVIIANSAKQAALMNRGGRFRIFNKTAATMPKRQFMGKSTRLMGKVKQFVREEIHAAFNDGTRKK
ncbi:MAG: hypothetical protein AB7G44_03440 [Bacteroidia bacterium]